MICPQHAPYLASLKFNKDQKLDNRDNTPLLDKKGQLRIQQIIGSYLYYACSIDPTIYKALSTLSTQQSPPTKKTNILINQPLDYMWTHPNATIRFVASQMLLQVHTDASYLNEPKAQSTAKGHFFKEITLSQENQSN